MDGDRQPELLRQAEHPMVSGCPGPFASSRRAQCNTLDALTRRPRELALGVLGEAEREVRDRASRPPLPAQNSTIQRL